MGAFTKEYNDEGLLIIFNSSEESKEIDISNKSVLNKNISDMELCGCLMAYEETIEVGSDKIIIPSKGIVILK